MREITDIKEVQQTALNILVYIDKICSENNIKYSLAGGTLLGAIRHKGFIPWDDDIDIMMHRDEYEKFLKVMDEDAKTNKKFKCLHYSKNCPDYYYRFTKVVDLDTHLEESNIKTPKDSGIFVDVFPLDGIDMKKAKKLISKTVFLGRMVANASMTKAYIKNDKKGKALIKKCFVYPFAKMFGPNFWMKKYEKIAKSYKVSDYDNTICYCGCYREKDIMPKALFDEMIDLDFEGYKFMAVKDYEYYLISLFGDYMTPPPPEKRITHHDFRIYKKKDS